MMVNPSGCRALLETAVVIASVTQAHRLLGGSYTHHEDLYRRMLKGACLAAAQARDGAVHATGIALQPTS